MVEVKVIIGATAAYACIRDGVRTLDVRLNPGRSAAQALREYIDDERRRAADILRRAELAECAADQLAQRKAVAV